MLKVDIRLKIDVVRGEQMKIFFIFLSFLIFTNNAWSGNEKGNGGIVLYCVGKPSQLFDFYEAENLHHFQFRKKIVSGDEWVIVSDVTQMLQQKRSELAMLVKKDLEIFKKNSRFLTPLQQDLKHQQVILMMLQQS